MATIKIELRGIDDLKKKIARKKDMAPVKAIVSKNGALLQNKTIENMNSAYTAGYSTGATARSVTNEISNGGMTATVGPHTSYFPYLEYGTRFMSARPTLKPAFTYQSVQFVNDLKKWLKE